MITSSVGNDIVDFSNETNKHLDRRFRQRVFSSAENQVIDSAKNPSAMLWQLWAAKEAAFKAYQQQYLHCIFSPILFQVDVTLKIVRYCHTTIFVKWQWMNQTTCHALALLAKNRSLLNKVKWLIEKGAFENLSVAVRKLALNAIPTMKGNLCIKRIPYKMPDGRVKKSPPAYYLNNQKLPLSLSLSHDGHYIGISILETD